MPSDYEAIYHAVLCILMFPPLCYRLSVTSSLLSLPISFRILTLSLHAEIILAYLSLMRNIHRRATCQEVIGRPVNAEGRVRYQAIPYESFDE